jgi:lipid A disaccharide synthetase
MKPDLIAKIPHKYADKFAVVGDLMADVGLQVGRLQVESSDLPSNLQPLQTWATPRCANNLQPSNLQPLQTWATPRCANNLQPSNLQPSNLQPLQTFNLQPSNLQLSNIEPSTELIGLLPGSKPAKLAQGVPLTLAIAQHIHAAKPQTRFVIPVAPTLDISALARFADPQHNPLIHQLGWGEAELVVPTADTDNKTLLKTTSGLCIELWQEFPAYELLSQCCICLTTVGANTAELGSLAVPMLVLLPTQQLDAMRAWDGIPGLLVRLPGIGQSLAKIINFIIIQQVVRQKRLFAWPNIWAKKEIVPELFGKIQPQDVARLVLDYLEHPEKLEEMRSRLRAVRGQPGAAQKLAQLVREELYQ